MSNQLIDFSNCQRLFSNLDGAAQKIRIKYDDEAYILKFGNELEPNEKKPLQGSYNHAPHSEWLGCHIVEQLGLPVQSTLLGLYGGRSVVACKDFVAPLGRDYQLTSFKNLEGNIISSSKRDKQPHLETMIRVFNEHPDLVNFRESTQQRYWNTFIADAIIGNFDRHGGNWGYIAHISPDGMQGEIVNLAPIYDCGSSMAPRLSEEAMSELIDNPALNKQRALSFPKACLKVEGEKISYHELLMSDYGQPARNALMNMLPKIEQLDIDTITRNMPDCSNIRRQYYKTFVESRIDAILQPAFELECGVRNLEPHSIVERIHATHQSATTTDVIDGTFQAMTSDTETPVELYQMSQETRERYERLLSNEEVAEYNPYNE